MNFLYSTNKPCEKIKIYNKLNTNPEFSEIPVFYKNVYRTLTNPSISEMVDCTPVYLFALNNIFLLDSTCCGAVIINA